MRLLDRHIVREYLRALIAVALILTVVTLVSIVLEHVDDVFEHSAPLATSLKWFILLLPHRLVQTVPVMVLLGVMFSIGNLSRHNEIIAINSVGISRARIFMPILLVTLALMGLTLWFDEEIVPRASALAERTHRVQIEGKPPPTQSRDIFLRGASDTYYWLDAYLDYPVRPRMVGPVVLRLAEDRSHVVERIEARWATHVRPQRAGGKPHWRFRGGTHLTYSAQGELIDVETFREKQFELEEDLSEFLSVHKEPEEMNFRELRRFIRILEQRPGVDLDEYRTELHLKLAFPLALIVVAMMAFPCAMKTRAGSLLIGFSMAIFFIIAFYTFTAILRSLGHEGHLWPWFAAWSPDLVFLVAASYFLGLWRT